MLGIVYFVKIFSEKCHAEAMLEGRLFLNRLSYYKNLEDVGRADPDEATIIIQGDIITDFTVNGHKIESIARIRRRLNWMNHFHIFSLVAKGPETKNDTIENFRKQLAFPGHQFKPVFGEYCVVVYDVSQFIDRVETACKREQYPSIQGLVNYYDPDRDSVGIDRKDSLDAILNKRNEFSYQSEYRFGVWTGTYGCDPIILNVGPIHDIAVLKNTEDTDDIISISPPDDPMESE